MLIIGVDPGVHGAVCILNTYKFRDVQCIPLVHNTLTDIFTFLSEIRGGDPCNRARANHVQPRFNLTIVDAKESTYPPENSPYPKGQVLQSKDTPYDNTMEMWLEEPGQIVVNRKISTKDGKRDNTGALLAGMKASRALGRSIGQWEGIAAALNISINLVPPKTWQSALNSPTRGDKNISKKCAYTIFPFLTNRAGKTIITHDIADALLIATYGYMQYADRKYYPASLCKQLR